MNDEHQAFDRPTTFITLLFASLSPRNPLYHSLTEEDIQRWQRGSQEVYRRFVDKPELLEQVVHEPVWDISSERPPANVWFGEAKFKDDASPQVIVYRYSLTTQIWPAQVFELAGQSGMDHLFGHLYPFYSGERHDEEVACRLQYRAAQQREGLAWTLAANALPLSSQAPWSR